MWDLECKGWYETIWKALEHGKKCKVFVSWVLPAVIPDHFMTDCFECGIHMMDMLEELRILMNVT